jgi:phosphate:Na+ symporter
MIEPAEVDVPSLSREVINMCDLTRKMLELTWEGFRKLNRESLAEAESLGREIHRKEKHLIELAIAEDARNDAAREPEYLRFFPSHLERIGDNIELIIRCTNGIIGEGICYSNRAIDEINTLFGKSVELLECLKDALIVDNEVRVTHILEDSQKFHETVSEYSIWHYDRLIKGNCIPKASSSFLAMLDYFSEIIRYIRDMAEGLSCHAVSDGRGRAERVNFRKIQS